ncbi:MAG: glycosyltransferase family 2 protein [Nitrosomonadales bacterium]
MNISILILTYNESQNLPGCLESVSWSDDIVVLDSYSTDGTMGIAMAKGARVIQRSFDNWASHQNWAVREIHFQHPWVFYLDADERMTSELRAEIETIAADINERRVAFYCGRKNYFMGKWIRHSYPPSRIMRFFRPNHVKFERLVNPTAVIDGPHGYLLGLFTHYNFSKGITEWLDKHNRYSTWEAIEGLRVLRGEDGHPPNLFSCDSAQRRKALKRLSFRLPCRSTIKFLYLYLICGGICDGYAGLIYCRLQAIYEGMISAKMIELLRRERDMTI